MWQLFLSRFDTALINDGTGEEIGLDDGDQDM